MLRKETDRNFLIYPSWAQIPAKWADLPRLMADPLGSGLLQRHFDPKEFGYPDVPQEHAFIPGSEGNGIIVLYNDPRVQSKWLAGRVLREAQWLNPNGMRAFDEAQREPQPFVCYIEPMVGSGWWIGVAKKPIIVVVNLSYEHVEAAGDSVYWLVRYQRTSRGQELKRIADVAGWAANFGITVRRAEQFPEAVQAEAAGWFINPECASVWFDVFTPDDGIGFNFAVLVYIANHLRWIAGPRVKSMHLLAQIEGRPQICSRWNSRSRN
jgi:hypothetical protein